MTEQVTRAKALVSAFRDRGMKRMFGVPGGGSSLDLIAAAVDLDVEFVLCRGETSAALMAAVSGELTGAPHIALTGIAPGAASAVNGVAYASLERAPMAIITDAREPGASTNSHQVFDQAALFAPVTKTFLGLDETTTVSDIQGLMDAALTAPQGPVHIDLSTRSAKSLVQVGPTGGTSVVKKDLAEGDLDDLVRRIEACRKPVLIIGLEARDVSVAAQVEKLANHLQCPVLTTYKAKGVYDETRALFVGHFTGAMAEGETLNQADLIIGIGLDPVEIIPGQWTSDADLLTMSTVADHVMPVEPVAVICGSLVEITRQVVDQLAPGTKDWTGVAIRSLRQSLSDRLALRSSEGLTTDDVVVAARSVMDENWRATVDAGAHMFSTMSRWTARRPHDVLKSNGLSTMGFALPAGIAAALVDPTRPVVAFTGDGGMMMCLAELSTAVRLGCNITVIVLNDGALSLIDVKQQRLQHASSGVRFPQVDFRSCAEGMGCPAWQVDTLEQLGAALDSAMNTAGPALIDVHVDPSGYVDQLEALRG